MKKIWIFFLVAVFAMSFAPVGTAQAANIDLSIFDNQNHLVMTGGGNSSSATSVRKNYLTSPVDEDNTLTSGVASGQQWDMEMARRVNSNLVLIGGYNWNTDYYQYNTSPYYRVTTGHLMLKITNDPAAATNAGGATFGHFNTPTPHSNNSNATFLYDFAVKFDFQAGTYSYAVLDSNTTFQLVNDVYYKTGPVPVWGNTAEAQYSNPIFANVSAWTDGGSLSLPDPVTSAYGLQGVGTNINHYVLTLNNFYNVIPDLDTADGLFGHISMSCGNDTLTFFDATPNEGVPLPGAALLMGAGLARLVAYSRKRRQIA